MALTGLPAKPVPEKSTQPPQTEINEPSSMPKPPKQKSEAIPQNLTDQEQLLAARVVAGEFGEQPRMRDVMALAKASHPTVAKVMDHLVEKNQIRLEKRKYFLIQRVIG